MRYVCMISAFFTLIISLHIPISNADSSEDKQSIIVEVEGDPKQHKEYIEVYHPFIDVVATYETLFNGLALQAEPDK